MKIIKVAAISISILVALYYAAFGVLYFYGYRVFKYPTLAMQPTIQKDERFIARISNAYRDRAKRYDIVLYQTKDAIGTIYIKRVIGLPGERIQIQDMSILINGTPLDLPAAINTSGLNLKKCDLIIPNDAFFILGDFTSSSRDSRFHGPIPKQDILGFTPFKN